MFSEKTWNRITFWILVFVGAYFMFATFVAYASETDSMTIQEEVLDADDIEMMILACASSYAVVAQGFGSQHHVKKAFGWREFYIGWNDMDETKSDRMINQAYDIIAERVDEGILSLDDLATAVDGCDQFEIEINTFMDQK
jgi:hypothetical protein